MSLQFKNALGKWLAVGVLGGAADDAAPLPVTVAQQNGAPVAAVSYRSGVAAADVLAAAGTVTTSLVAGGSLATSAMNVKVVPGNAYGRVPATAGGAQTPSAGNLTVRAAFAAVVGATYYDIYLSTDADPKWVGRITETQRASGIVITAVGVTGAGGTAGAVDVQVAGTGLQSATTAVVDTAARPDVAGDIDCTGYRYVDFDLDFSRTGDAVAPSLILLPFFKDDGDSAYYEGQPVQVYFGGATGQYDSLRQTLRVEARGRTVALCVLSMSGTGAALNVRYKLS